MGKNTIKAITLFLLALIELISFYLASCETKFIPKIFWDCYAINQFPLIVSIQLFSLGLMTSFTLDYKDSTDVKYGYYCFTILQFISIISAIFKIQFPFYVELIYEVFLSLIVACGVLNIKNWVINKF